MSATNETYFELVSAAEKNQSAMNEEIDEDVYMQAEPTKDKSRQKYLQANSTEMSTTQTVSEIFLMLFKDDWYSYIPSFGPSISPQVKSYHFK